MTIFKNIINDTIEHQRNMKQLEKQHISPLITELVITIPLEEYKELLIYKGKYLGLKDKTKETTHFIDGKAVTTILEDEE